MMKIFKTYLLLALAFSFLFISCEDSSVESSDENESVEPSDETGDRDTETVVVDVLNPATGKTWMDRNLGASRAATSMTDAAAYGDLYQWGRAADGHQRRNSGIDSTQSTSNQPGHGRFIVDSEILNDWRNPQNDNLWQGVNGINNPCPVGYRLPTAAEWDAEIESWSSDNAAGAFASPLKLPLAGSRFYIDGLLYNSVGSRSHYWSDAVIGIEARGLYFDNMEAHVIGFKRANGFSVRCLKN